MFAIANTTRLNQNTPKQYIIIEIEIEVFAVANTTRHCKHYSSESEYPQGAGTGGACGTR